MVNGMNLKYLAKPYRASEGKLGKIGANCLELHKIFQTIRHP